VTTEGAARPRLPLLSPETLDPELRLMLDRWQAEGGDPNFILTLARLPETLKRFIAFYSPLVRKGVVEHRTKELARLRLAQLNHCAY
jgi:alkylhydroperoxidase family enzyme